MSGVYFEIFPTEGFNVRSATRYEEKLTKKKEKKEKKRSGQCGGTRDTNVYPEKSDYE